MQKNLLSDTDFTKGHDNRFGITAAFGRVSKIECTAEHANVRVIMPDRVDHKNTPLISKSIPVLQIASSAKKSFAVPRLNDVVALVKLPNGTSNYAVLGSFYTKKNPPPVTDPMLDHTLYDDGSTMQFDASKGQLDWKLTGDLNWDNKGAVLIKLEKGFTIQIQGDVLIDAPNIHLKGAMNFEGDITHTGGMSTTGIHTAADGPHASCGLAQGELEERIASLERRIAQLEARG
jgi:phage baseplate assembly protein V